MKWPWLSRSTLESTQDALNVVKGQLALSEQFRITLKRERDEAQAGWKAALSREAAAAAKRSAIVAKGNKTRAAKLHAAQVKPS